MKQKKPTLEIKKNQKIVRLNYKNGNKTKNTKKMFKFKINWVKNISYYYIHGQNDVLYVFGNFSWVFFGLHGVPIYW